jgi:excisionase family DNA binding protein
MRFSEGKMESKALGERSSYQLMSLASRIKAIHHAMTAEELADLLKVARLTILRRAKRGTIPGFRVGTCVRFDPANISKWLVDMGVKRMSKP